MRWSLWLVLCVLWAGCSGSQEAHRGDPVPDGEAVDGGGASVDDAQQGEVVDVESSMGEGGGVDVGVDVVVEDAVDDSGESADGEGCALGYGRVEETAPIGESAVVEASGLVASRRTPGMLWTHNDSGDDAVLYALGEDGRALGRVTLTGVTARDFEDIAAGPCPDGSGPCLWVADVGNNSRSREDLVVYVVPEPVFSDDDGGVLSVAPLLSLPVSYPDDNMDCEAVVVTPDGQGLYFIEKVDEPSARIFKHPGPLGSGEPAVLEEVGVVSSPGVPISRGWMITGADLHPSGRRLVMRLYVGSFEYVLEPGQTVASLGEVTPRQVAAGPLSEPQGEAIAYDEQGKGVWTLSEGNEVQRVQPLHYYPCLD